MAKKQRLLLKISGGELKNLKDCSFFDSDLLKNIVDQIKTLSKEYQVGVVLGGGNIWRGKDSNLSELSNVKADYMGMLATVMNGIVLQDFLQQAGVKATLFSAISCDKITKVASPIHVDEAFNNGEVAIFSGGTGYPFVTTDTAAVIRATEINASVVLFGKAGGIKGVYDKDPRIHSDAVFFSKLSYQEVLQKQLKIIDSAAFAIAAENNLKFLIFDQSIKNSFVDAVYGKIELTVIENTKK